MAWTVAQKVDQSTECQVAPNVTIRPAEMRHPKLYKPAVEHLNPNPGRANRAAPIPKILLGNSNQELKEWFIELLVAFVVIVRERSPARNLNSGCI